MMISTRGRYALRLMLDIAINEKEEPIRVKEIAERQDISDKYLEQIIAALVKAGLVKSLRGPQGGYRLNKKPEEYTVGSILRVTEGKLSPVACLEDEVNQCPRKGECITIGLWEKLNDAIKEIVDNTTLQDMIDEHRDKADDYII